tara:strand:- start:678 stop:935 length:258 start_codon:yes stop_codon:yes gene_type:complete
MKHGEGRSVQRGSQGTSGNSGENPNPTGTLSFFSYAEKISSRILRTATSTSSQFDIILALILPAKPSESKAEMDRAVFYSNITRA